MCVIWVKHVTLWALNIPVFEPANLWWISRPEVGYLIAHFPLAHQYQKGHYTTEEEEEETGRDGAELNGAGQ